MSITPLGCALNCLILALKGVTRKILCINNQRMVGESK